MKYVLLIGLGVAAGALVTTSVAAPGLPYYAISAGILIAASGYAGGQVISAIKRKDRP